ncbi:MAG TPA: transglycosylase domain-containing protein [Candidatus Polarisedimenticolia bacterium]|jgi:penicillin-binding protein 1A|nr:transglycosylase domain-containing protein [Candidatus Polarisedimenticolia bacterium]
MLPFRTGSLPLPNPHALDGARAARPRPAWTRRALLLLAAPAGLTLFLAAGFAHHVYFDRQNLPDLGPFLRFEPPTTGEIYDDRGKVLIQLAREYRRVVSYDEVPLILRQAILAAEDKNFLTHSGVEYRAFPRVVEKSAAHSLAGWWKGDGFRLCFPQGGSTLTQQLVRTYFLQDLTVRENSDLLIEEGMTTRTLAAILGVRATNKLLRKTEEIRLSLWIEEEMLRRHGSRERAKREIFARYASFIYLGNGRYGFAAASEYYFGKPLSLYTPDDAAEAALLAGIGKSPRAYAPTSGTGRPLDRRNAILGLMARDGFISESRAQRFRAEPIRLSERSLVKTEAPGAIASVLAELALRGGTRFTVEDLLQGRISVYATVDGRAQTIVNEALERGLALYEKRHRRSTGLIQGSVVVLRNADAAILAETGGRRVFKDRSNLYSDFNRVTGSLRQPGSAWKPMVYLAAFHRGLDLDTTVPDAPISVPGGDGAVKWIANYDHRFKGRIPVRQALAESRNAVAVWLAREVGISEVNRTARKLGIRSPLHPYISTALGASEVRLLELASAYRAMASGLPAEPHVIARVTDASGEVVLYAAPGAAPESVSGGPNAAELSLIQEGLRGVVRLPDGTAHALDSPDFPIAVMGKTGTTSSFRDALFVGSTYGPQGITVAVRIGFDDNRTLGEKETGARAALPVFREIMLRIYHDGIAGPPPRFPGDIEARIDAYLATQSVQEAQSAAPPSTNSGARRSRR